MIWHRVPVILRGSWRWLSHRKSSLRLITRRQPPPLLPEERSQSPRRRHNQSDETSSSPICVSVKTVGGKGW